MDNQPDTCACEKIDAVRICLMGELHTMAVLAEFRSADRVLARWLACSTHAIRVDFKVTFFDGFVLCGCYQRRRRAKSVLSFTNYIRATIDAEPDLARYSIES